MNLVLSAIHSNLPFDYGIHDDSELRPGMRQVTVAEFGSAPTIGAPRVGKPRRDFAYSVQLAGGVGSHGPIEIVLEELAAWVENTALPALRPYQGVA